MKKKKRDGFVSLSGESYSDKTHFPSLSGFKIGAMRSTCHEMVKGLHQYPACVTHDWTEPRGDHAGRAASPDFNSSPQTDHYLHPSHTLSCQYDQGSTEVME